MKNLSEVLVGFYEDEYPVYSKGWTHELQSPVTVEELNGMVARIRELETKLKDGK